MTILSHDYSTLKDATNPVVARQAILDTLAANKGNVARTARALRCSRTTIYLALRKQRARSLDDRSHKPLTRHPKTTPQDVVEKILHLRKAGFGKARLQALLAIQYSLQVPQSTIGAILKRHHCSTRKKRIRRHSKPRIDWNQIRPFETIEIDTKEIADKRTLPKETYDHLRHSPFLPRWQWTAIDVVTRMRFLAYSTHCDWSCGQLFGKLIVSWLRLFGFTHRITLQSDGGQEFAATYPAAFQRSVTNIWQPLNVARTLIRKGHPEDNPFVERSHQTDDNEFYIPYLTLCHSQLDFLRYAAWWIRLYNTERPHMGLKMKTPFQVLKQKGYNLPVLFALFPPLLLDRLTTLPAVIPDPQSVQHHIDYDPYSRG
jgi:transposase InsO family protein